MKRLSLVLALALVATAASAQDLTTCQELYLRRNAWYRERGLCFTRDTAVAVFGTKGCKYRSASDMPMSDNERVAMRRFIQIERSLGCGRDGE